MASSIYLWFFPPSRPWIKFENAYSITKNRSAETTEVGRHPYFTEQNTRGPLVDDSPARTPLCVVRSVGFWAPVKGCLPPSLVWYCVVLTRRCCDVNLGCGGFSPYNGFTLRAGEAWFYFQCWNSGMCCWHTFWVVLWDHEQVARL